MHMKILIVPHTILTQKARVVNVFDKRIKRIVDDMKNTLEAQTNPLGVGLAAPQVGIPLRIFIIKPTKKSPIKIFINPDLAPDSVGGIGINPVIMHSDNAMPPKTSRKKPNKLEGCLSLPFIWATVTRKKTICLAYQSLDEEDKKEYFSGFEATIIQHELDHLDGIIFTQRVVEQNQTLYEEKNGELVKLTVP